MHNLLTRSGMNVITEMDEFVHVSGHPARDELSEMYNLVKPEISVPVHGEARHLKEHCALAESLQVPQAIEITNGNILKLARARLKLSDRRIRGDLRSMARCLLIWTENFWQPGGA